MTDYYAERLAGQRLRRCYEIASPRVRQYLEAEIAHVLERLRPTDAALELGCGYGRITVRMAPTANRVVGIDNAADSIEMARREFDPGRSCEFLCMDALDLRFPDGTFDAVVCLQNGICAFGIDQAALLREAMRVTRPGGMALFSSYSDRFWPERLAWFEAQAADGLLGVIDRAATGEGTIVCQDGFRSGRMRPEDFRSLCARAGVEPAITEIDGSCVFCQITKPGAAPQGHASS